jgi:polar amino acid transport system substrate-binding protein
MWKQKWFFLTCGNKITTFWGCALALAGTVQAAAPLTVVTEELAPYSYVAHGRMTGYSTEVVRAALERTKLAYSLQIYPWARAFQMARTQPNVLIYSIVRTPEREGKFEWIAQIAPRAVYLYKLAARHDIKVRSLDDLRPYRIAATRNDVVDEQLQQLKLTADLAANDESNLRKLEVGRVDLMVASALSMPGICERAGVSCALLERIMIMPGLGDYYVAASLGTPRATLQALRAGFAQVRNSGQMQRLAEQFDVPLR